MSGKRNFAFSKPGKSKPPDKKAANAERGAGEAVAPAPIIGDLRDYERRMREVLSPEAVPFFDGLSEYYRHVFLVWANNGYNQSEAVRAVRPDLKPGSARYMGWFIINNRAVARLRLDLLSREHKTLELLRDKAAGVELDAMEAVDAKGKPDHMTRLRAARQVRMLALRAGPLFNVNFIGGQAAGAGSGGGGGSVASSPIDDLLNMKASKVVKAAIAAKVVESSEEDEEGES